MTEELEQYIDGVIDTIEDRLEQYIDYREGVFADTEGIPDDEVDDPYVEPGDMYADEKYLVFEMTDETDEPYKFEDYGEDWITLIGSGCPVVMPDDGERKLALAIQKGKRYKERAVERLVDAYEDLSVTAGESIEHEIDPEDDPDPYDEHSLDALYEETIDRRDGYPEGSEPYNALQNLADRIGTAIDRFGFTETHYNDASVFLQYVIDDGFYDDGDRVTGP